jgi:hypothetical protein
MQPVQEAVTKPRAKIQTQRVSKQTENLDRKIEVLAIKYVCPSINHPNHALNDRIDRYPIDQRIGYGTHIIKKDVCYYEYLIDRLII